MLTRGQSVVVAMGFLIAFVQLWALGPMGFSLLALPLSIVVVLLYWYQRKYRRHAVAGTKTERLRQRPSEARTLGDVTTVLVRLVDESVDVWRPVLAADRGDGRYQLLRPDGSADDSEVWEFPVGATVECEITPLSEGPALVAVRQTRNGPA